MRDNMLMLVRKRGAAALNTKINTTVPRVGAQQQKITSYHGGDFLYVIRVIHNIDILGPKIVISKYHEAAC